MDVSVLLNPERRLLSALKDHGGAYYEFEDAMRDCGETDQAIMVGAAYGLRDHGLIEVFEEEIDYYYLDELGAKAVEKGLLEDVLFSWILEQSNPTMQGLQNTFEKHEAGPGIGLLKKLGVSLESGEFVYEHPEKIKEQIQERAEFILALESCNSQKEHYLEAMAGSAVGGDWDEMIAHFSGRKGFIRKVVRTDRAFSITKKGELIPDEELDWVEVVTSITPELLQGDAWKTAEFRAFDVSLEAATPRTGRSHPMQALIERIRAIFLEMGFSELVDDYVQSAGWNMDALFIPQDHPAREMQDTFYLDQPASIELDEGVMHAWKAIHEHGGDTGSTGWGGSYSTEVSKRPLLRTHTTVNTIQYLANHPIEACRVFSVDRVFRKEAIDRTHLPEFHQIEGIIMEEGANLQMLVTTLKTFYAKMGYPEVRVRPAYFPYTEPSLEIEVKWRGKWLELGGAGIFRPEVTEPLGITSPVLAWGMGLERLAMLVLGLDDIRQLYISDLEWLRNQPVL